MGVGGLLPRALRLEALRLELPLPRGHLQLRGLELPLRQLGHLALLHCERLRLLERAPGMHRVAAWASGFGGAGRPGRWGAGTGQVGPYSGWTARRFVKQPPAPQPSDALLQPWPAAAGRELGGGRAERVVRRLHLHPLPRLLLLQILHMQSQPHQLRLHGG